MHLPAKFLPQHNQRIASVVGSVVMTVIGLVFMTDYLPSGAPEKGQSFSQWLSGGNSVQLFFLLVSIGMVLFGLAALAVTLLDLVSGSPFNHLIIDRFGIRCRSFFGEKQVSWKDLGPIRVLRLSTLRGSRRFWIVSDTFSGEERSDFRRPLSSFNLRIQATAYLGTGWFSSGVSESVDAAAAWLEGLRQMAREDRLESDNAPEAPEPLGTGVALGKPPAEAVPTPPSAPAAPAPDDLPPMEERKFGRRDGSTVER